MTIEEERRSAFIATMRERLGPGWGIARQAGGFKQRKERSKEVVRRAARISLIRLARKNRLDPPCLSPSLLSKLQSSGHIQQATEAA